MADLQRYQYTAQSRIGSTFYIFRPLVDVEVSGESKTRTFKALVDSGTEITVMDMNIARLLSIPLENRAKGILSGIDSDREGRIAPISIKIQGFEKVFTFGVLFIEDLGKNFDIILGQQDFFQNFHVTFKRSEKSFYLKHVE